MKKLVFAMLLCCFTPFALAHTALLSCFDENDGTITCEGGFSDGSSASGVNFRVEQKGNVILDARFDEYNEVNFPKPDSNDYVAIFDGGDGHTIKINGKDIQ